MLKNQIMTILVMTFIVFVSLQNNAGAQETSLKDIFARKQLAISNMDINELSKYMSSEVISAIKGEKDPKATLYLMKYLSPIEYKTGKETFSGNKATMEIIGKARNPGIKGGEDSFKGVINYKKEGNSWKVSSEDIKYAVKSVSKDFEYKQSTIK